MAEQEGAARVGAVRQKTAQQLGTAQARLAAPGSDLAGSPLDVLGDIGGRARRMPCRCATRRCGLPLKTASGRPSGQPRWAISSGFPLERSISPSAKHWESCADC